MIRQSTKVDFVWSLLRLQSPVTGSGDATKGRGSGFRAAAAPGLVRGLG